MGSAQLIGFVTEEQINPKLFGPEGGSVIKAAKALGLSRSALYRRLEHFGLKKEE